MRGSRNFFVPFTVYVLQSERDGRYYIGYTADIQQRLRRHRLGLVKSTRNRRPLNLVYSEQCATIAEAKARERWLKRQKGGIGFRATVNHNSESRKTKTLKLSDVIH